MVDCGKNANQANGPRELPNRLRHRRQDGSKADPEMENDHKNRARKPVGKVRGNRGHASKQHKAAHPIDHDFLIAEAEIPAGIIGRLGKDQHDKMVKKMADIQIEIRNTL